MSNFKYPFYIKGNPTNGKEALEILFTKAIKVNSNLKQLSDNSYDMGCNDSDSIYYIDNNNTIKRCQETWQLYPYITELFTELKSPEWKPSRGEKVLVRDCESELWREAIFSFYSNNEGYDRYYVEGGISWSKITKFDINKLGKYE